MPLWVHDLGAVQVPDWGFRAWFFGLNFVAEVGDQMVHTELGGVHVDDPGRSRGWCSIRQRRVRRDSWESLIGSG